MLKKNIFGAEPTHGSSSSSCLRRRFWPIIVQRMRMMLHSTSRWPSKELRNNFVRQNQKFESAQDKLRVQDVSGTCLWCFPRCLWLGEESINIGIPSLKVRICINWVLHWSLYVGSMWGTPKLLIKYPNKSPKLLINSPKTTHKISL